MFSTESTVAKSSKYYASKFCCAFYQCDCFAVRAVGVALGSIAPPLRKIGSWVRFLIKGGSFLQYRAQFIDPT